MAFIIEALKKMHCRNHIAIYIQVYYKINTAKLTVKIEYSCPMKFYLLPNKDGMICWKSIPANINNICLPMANNLIKCRDGRTAQLSPMT